MIFKLAEITIIQGEEYRLKADTTKVKNIPTSAPRGLITDTYGRVLAENITSNTVQIMKDELDEDNRKLTSLKIMSLLERQGEAYVDDFPIVLNTIDYKNDEKLLSSNGNVNDEITDLLIKNKLLDDLLDKTYEHITNYNEYRFSVANRALSIIGESKEIVKIPIKVDYSGDNVTYEYKEGEDIESWKSKHDLSNGNNPKSDILKLLLDDTKRINALINHPIVSKYAYELLDEKGLMNDFKLIDYQFSFDIEHRDMKKMLISEIETDLLTEFDDDLSEEDHLELYGESKKSMSEQEKLKLSKRMRENYPLLYPTIDLETTAKEDFVALITYKEFKNFMFSNTDEGEDAVTVGEKLIDYLKTNNINIPIVYSPEKGDIFKYTDDKKGNEFLTKYNLDKNFSADIALEIFVKTHFIEDKKIKNSDEVKNDSISKTIFGKFITSKDIKGYSQSFLLNYINPKISTSKWEYTFLIDKNTWIKGKNIKKYNNAKDVFDKLVKKYEVDKLSKNNSEKLSVFEKRFILLIIDTLNKQGYRAYEPINIAYNVKDETVAMIREQSRDLPGVKTSIEPMRYYPLGETAAHVLGYLGKISQESEIEKYIDELGYSRNDIIGKTGIEKQFERYLDGEDGFKTLEVDAYGNIHKTIEGESPVPGNDIRLTIDSELQKVAEEALEETIKKLPVAGTYESEWGDYKFSANPLRKNANSGAAVAIDVNTGEILAMANYPSYDPNLFATGISTEDYENLKPENENDNLAARPLNNLAARSAIPPGSTFKLITSLAGLENGLNPYTKINSLGYIMYGGKSFGCWYWNDYGGIHGPTDLFKALEVSCNYYYYTLAAGKNLRTGEELGLNVSIEDMQNMSRKFGLDEKTGIEIPEEKSGTIPNEGDKIAVANMALKTFLKGKGENLIEGKEVTDEDLDELIEIFADWANQDEKMSVSEVVEGLNNLNIEESQVSSIKDYLYYTYFREAGFRLTDAFSISIGQGENSYTPLQMANVVATIANGGYKRELTLIDGITDYEGREIDYKNNKKVERIELKDYKYLDYVKEGMLRVTTEGSVSKIFSNLPVKVGGKTGTAEAWGDYDNFAWFVGFAPYDDPQIAVATVIFQGGSGGNAAPVVRDIIAKYLGVNQEIDEMDVENKLVR
nr:penicillin-binding transpeptidase domain-containing protein [Anaeromonas gelatinilytica]